MKDRIAAHPDFFKDVLGKGVDIAEVLEKIDEENLVLYLQRSLKIDK